MARAMVVVTLILDTGWYRRAPMARKGDRVLDPSPLPGLRFSPTERLVVLLSAAALGVWTLVAVLASYHPLPSLSDVALVLALTTLTPLTTSRAGERLGALLLGWDEAALLVGMVLVGPAWFVLLAAPSVLLVHVVTRRSWSIALCDAAGFVIASGLACAVARAVSAGRFAITPRGIGALAVSVVLFGVVIRVMRRAPVARSETTRTVRLLPLFAPVDLGVLAANVAAAVLLLAIVDRDASPVVTLPLVVTVLFLAGRESVSRQQERHLAEQLEQASVEVNQIDEAVVVEAALARAIELFGCASAELQLRGARRRPPRSYAMSAGEPAVSRPGSAGVAEAAEGNDVVFAVLSGATGEVGRLRLRLGPGAHLTRREQHALRTFAQVVAAAVLNAGLYDDVRAEEARQAHEATHDSLTGLANRVLLQEQLRAAVAQRHNLTTCLLLLDVDHFKEINDTLGHTAGDFLLQRVADRLNSLSRPGDLVSRLGGDEFAVLLTGLESAAEAGPAAERLLGLLAEPVVYEGMRLSVEGSVGVACYPADAPAADELLRRAEVAMYQAKSDRGSWVRYQLRHDDSSVDRLALIAELRSALDRDEIVVHFQPQADLRTGEILGVEALARWEHPRRGILPPTDFVGVAEQSGLVRPFTLRVLDLAVAECAAWTAKGCRATVAVNLAARSLLDGQLPHDVAAVLARHSLSPDRLVLEITESIATSELEMVEEVLGRLRRLGVAISVDDFGTGYSSLAFLQRTAVNELKVDRSFVLGMLTSESDLALVRTTVQLAHSLGARAVAEGVENGALAEALRGLGCDLAQGYWLSRPVPAPEIRQILGVDIVASTPFAVPEPRTEQALPVTRLRIVEG
jgi:diguanylate cyclase (GGDEF)-like protein